MKNYKFGKVLLVVLLLVLASGTTWYFTKDELEKSFEKRLEQITQEEENKTPEFIQDDLVEFSKNDQVALKQAFLNYNDINQTNLNEIVNFISLTDLQYVGSLEKEFDFNYLLKRIENVSKWENMDFGISIGDLNMATENKEIAIRNLKEVTKKFQSFQIPTYFTLGNHDRFIKHKPKFDISKEEYFDITFSNVDDSYHFNPNELKEPYYYKDIENKKLRICVLNSFSKGNYEYVINEEQLKFIASDMLDFSSKEKPEEWTVAFFIHTVTPTGFHNEEVENAEVLLEILSAYQTGSNYQNQKIHADFSGKTRATISAIFTGHHHLDYTLIKNDILIIGMDSVRTKYNRGPNKEYANYTQYPTDISFEVISIDTKNRKIYSTKVGNGENRFWKY